MEKRKETCNHATPADIFSAVMATRKEYICKNCKKEIQQMRKKGGNENGKSDSD